MELLSKNELLEEFEVEASFYNITIGDQTFECRNQAKVKRKSIETDEFDAIFVLVNPGSCNPLDKNFEISEIDPRNDLIPFVKAKSDSTQWQIMRLMKLKEWDQVNIINLSDLCSGSLKIFRAKLAEAESLSFHHHSIFSDERQKELKKILDANKGPVILGWGTERFIKNKANEVLQNHLIVNYIGWRHSDDPYYFHPNQRLKARKIEWLKNIEKMLV